MNIEGKILNKCIYIALYNHFLKFLSKSQYGFVRRRSVQTNMLLFLKKIHEAFDQDSHSVIIVFYTDFSKIFHRYGLEIRFSQYGLVQKLIDIGVVGCLLEILIDHLKDRLQYVRVDNTSSKI